MGNRRLKHASCNRPAGYGAAAVWTPVLTGVSALLFSAATALPVAAGQVLPKQHIKYPVDFGGPKTGPTFEFAKSVTFPANSSPFVMVGRQLWNLNTGMPVGKRIASRLNLRLIEALSQDGRRFVNNASEAPNSDHGGLNVWSTRTGKRVALIPFKPESPSPSVLLGQNNLVLVRPMGKPVQVFDLQSPHSPIRIPIDARGMFDLAVSPGGGRLFGYQHRDSAPSIIPVRSASEPIQVDISSGFPAPADESRRLRNGLATPPTTMTLAFANGAAFSADGKHIACAAGRPARLIIWNTKGQCVTNRRLVGLGAIITTVQWQPAGKFLLLGNLYVIQASSGEMVAVLPSYPGNTASTNFIGNRRIAWVDNSPPTGSIRIYHLPIHRIQDSLRALRRGAGGILARPGGRVRVVYHIIGPTSDPQVIRQRLGQDVAQCALKNDGHLAPYGRLTMDITWHKLTGKRMQDWVKKNPFEYRAVNTGRIVRDDRARLPIRLQRSASGRAIRQWRQTIETQRFISGAVNAQTLREGVLQQADTVFVRANIPYFIPSTPALISLPIYIRQ